MANGDDITINEEFDNLPTDIVTEVVELEVVNGALAIDPRDINPGVNSRNQ